MSQLADIEDVVLNTSLTSEEQGKLLFEILQALGWDIEGVSNAADALVYLTMRR